MSNGRVYIIKKEKKMHKKERGNSFKRIRDIKIKIV